jgi:hypothetical protein
MEMTMNVSAGFMTCRSALLPTLAVEIPGAKIIGDPEISNLLVSALLQSGFTPIDRMGTPPMADGWSALLDKGHDDHWLEILDPAGTSFYRGPLCSPIDWLSRVERRGWCVLFTKEGGLNGVIFDESSQLASLRTNPCKEMSVGARIPVTIN